MWILQMIYHMQIYAEINFIRGYLCPSLGVGGGGILMSYFVCCPAIT